MEVLASVDLLNLFIRELELCRVRAGETVVVLAESRSVSEYVSAAFGAAQRLGAQAMVVTLPGGSPAPLPSVRTGSGFGLKALEENKLALEVLKKADMVIDVTLEGFIHSPLLGEILGTKPFQVGQMVSRPGPRVLYVCEPPEVLARNLPSPEDKERALAAVERLRRAREMRVTSPAGTDLVIDVTNAPVGYQCGFSDDPGRWDHWPSTMVLCFPDNSGVNGTIVMQPGDILLPFKQFVQEPVRFVIESGRVSSVQGGVDAAVLNKYFEDSKDPDARMTSHFGWGLSRTADWTSLCMYNKESVMGMEARCFGGVFLWSTGPNPFLNRFTPFHLDLPMRGCSIYLDGVPVVEGGRLVAERG